MSPKAVIPWEVLVLGLGGVLALWLWFLWPVLGFGAHPSRIPVTDQTTDTAGTEFNASFFGTLQSNMENDIEDHRHTGGAEGRVLLSTAIVSMHLNQISGTLTSNRISPVLNIASDTIGSLTSARFFDLMTFFNISGTLPSFRIDPTLDLGLHTAGTLDSSRLAGSVVNALGSGTDGSFATGQIRLNCATWVQCPRTGQTIAVHLNSLRTQTILLTGAGGAPTTNQGGTGPTKLYQALSSTDFFGLGLESATQQSVFWNVVLPNSYQASTAVSYRVLWYPTGGAADQTVQFGVRARAYNDGQGVNDSGGGFLGGAAVVSVTDTFIGINSFHRTNLASLPLTIAGSPTGGSFVTFLLTRDTPADNLQSHAYVLGVEVLYPLSSFSDR